MEDRVLMKGNEAVGEAAVRAGCDCYYGYPITPQNELTAYMAAHMPAHGRVFLQAESEIAAISMVFGSAAAGKRAMTSSSSPGISLKQEGISFLAGARLPAVIVNVQRAGPGLGDITPSQADYFQAVKGGGHGDYHMIVLAPDSVQEMYDLTFQAFTLADRYRTPVMVLTDGRLGQMTEQLVLGDAPPPAPPAKPWAVTGCYGREPNMIRSLFLQEGDLTALNQLLQSGYRDIAAKEVRYEARHLDDCDVLVVAYGTSARVAKGAVSACREQGLRVGLLRPQTLWPFPSAAIRQAAARVRAVLVVEMSAGQMLEDVQLAVLGACPVRLHGTLGGQVPTVSEVCATLRGMLGS